jgi:hypothetical protein
LVGTLQIIPIAKYLIILLTGAVFTIIGGKYRDHIKIFGTASIGAFLIMKGFGEYFGGFSSLY